MRMIARHWQLALASMAIVACRPAQPPATITPTDAGARSVWSADFVTVRPGLRADYLRFLELNWARARRTALTQRQIRSYRVLLAPDTTPDWQIILLTEYPDSTAYARREEIFRPILDAQGRTLIGGRGTRELTERLVNRVVSAPLGQP
jgi:hypothetical protein